jgi:hypothetical protein
MKKFSAIVVANSGHRRKHGVKSLLYLNNASFQEAAMRRSSTLGLLVLALAVLANFSAALARPVIMQQAMAMDSGLPPGTTGPYNPGNPDPRF